MGGGRSTGLPSTRELQETNSSGEPQEFMQCTNRLLRDGRAGYAIVEFVSVTQAAAQQVLHRQFVLK